MNQSDPLSATIRPYSCIACATTRARGGSSEVFTDAFRRRRSPMRGSAGSSLDDAKCRAGNTNARRLSDTVMRSACVMRPRWTSG
jgi:hypothetical protein